MNNNNYAVKRWIIAVSGVFLQVVLGSVYAWSYFQKPVMTTYGWNNSQVAWIFGFAIFTRQRVGIIYGRVHPVAVTWLRITA